MRLDWSSSVLGKTGRRFALAGVVASGIGLAILASRYRGIAGPGALEAGLAGRLQEIIAQRREPLAAFILVGRPSTVIVAAVLMSAVALACRQPRVAVIALVAPPLTGAAATALQPVIGRTLEGGFALPSGHTAGATSIAIVAALLVTSLTSRYRGPVGVIAGLGVVLVAAAVSIALVVNGLHFVTDTLAGLCTALVVVLGVALLVDCRISGRIRADDGSACPDRRDIE